MYTRITSMALRLLTPRTEIRGVRLQAGLNFMFGGGALQCHRPRLARYKPIEVFAGEPVTATASGSNFNPKRTVKYDWNGTRGESCGERRLHAD